MAEATLATRDTFRKDLSQMPYKIMNQKPEWCPICPHTLECPRHIYSKNIEGNSRYLYLHLLNV